MRKSLITLIPLSFLLSSGCATSYVKQRDISLNEDGTSRAITTDIQATSWGSSKQSIEKFKTLQSDKTQSVGFSAGDQQGSTNIVRALQEIRAIIEMLPK